MKGRTFGKMAMRRLLTSLFAAGACFALGAQPAFSGESQPAPSGQTQAGPGVGVSPQTAQNPAPAPGLMIYIDPNTGAILKEPAPGTVPLQLTPQLQNALSTSDRGLVEVPSSVPGGGVKLDLQGRFQSPLFATIDANGKVKLLHLHEMPESVDKK